MAAVVAAVYAGFIVYIAYAVAATAYIEGLLPAVLAYGMVWGLFWMVFRGK